MNIATPITQDAMMEAMSFVWLEADLLDHAEYDPWLALWTSDARYVVPVEPGATDFENTLNYAYDDHELRAKRVERLRNGFSVSASPVARTIRAPSRFRILSDDGRAIELRCMQHLTEFRRDRERTHVADMEFRLLRTGDGIRIERKVIRLLKADHALTGISYIL